MPDTYPEASHFLVGFVILAVAVIALVGGVYSLRKKRAPKEEYDFIPSEETLVSNFHSKTPDSRTRALLCFDELIDKSG